MVINGEGGGDIYSLLSVVSEVQIKCAAGGAQAKITYLGQCAEYRLILEANAVKVHGIASGGFFGRLFGFLQSLFWLYLFMPDVIFSNGGGTASVLASAGRFYLIPFVFHERNARPEVRDQRAAKHAKAIALSYADTAKYFKSESYFTGEPVRSYIIPKPGETDRAFAKRMLNFDASKPLIFINGGSRGSPSLNRFIAENLPYILQISQVLHQTGREHYEDVAARVAETAKGAPEELLNGYRAVDYFEKEIKNAYMAADLVISRSGPSTLAELAAFGRPAMLVPAPESVSPTERYNASEHASAGAAIVIEEENLLPNMFLSNLQELMDSKEKLAAMSDAAKKLHKPNAASDLAEIVLKFRHGQS